MLRLCLLAHSKRLCKTKRNNNFTPVFPFDFISIWLLWERSIMGGIHVPTTAGSNSCQLIYTVSPMIRKFDSLKLQFWYKQSFTYRHITHYLGVEALISETDFSKPGRTICVAIYHEWRKMFCCTLSELSLQRWMLCSQVHGLVLLFMIRQQWWCTLPSVICELW